MAAEENSSGDETSGELLGFAEKEMATKAMRLFEITRKNGVISSREAAIRLGKSPAQRGIQKLMELRLLSELSEGIFGLSDRARRLIEKLGASEEVLGCAAHSRS